jgi:excisionase family DNA binding protein
MSLEDTIRDIMRAEIRSALAEAAQDAKPEAEILDSDGAALYLKMPVAVLRKRVRKGEVPAFKIGSLLRFRRSDLRSWLDAMIEQQKQQKAS